MTTTKTNRWATLLENQVVAIVLALILVVPVLFAGPYQHRTSQLVGYGFLGLLLLVVWLLRARDHVTREKLARLARSGPNLPILAYLGWGALSVALSVNRFYSQLAFIQLAFGVLVYAMVVYQFRHRTQVRALLTTLLIAGVLLVLGAFVLDADRKLMDLSGSFHDRQLFGAFLALLLPVLMGVAAGTGNRTWKLSAQFAAILVAVALLLTRCRSSWLGAVVAVAVFVLLGVMFVWKSQGLGRNKHRLLITPLLALAVIGITLGFARLGTPVQERVATFTKVESDASVVDRMRLWKEVALPLIAARPTTGWGIGTYALAQSSFNYISRGAGAIEASGPSLMESPHNTYLQLAGEVGLVGLLFYLAILASFFHYGIRALPRLDRGLRKFTLIGCLAAMSGQMVDAVANPGWMYPELTTFFWLLLGVGMCAAGLAQEVQEEARIDRSREPVLGIPRFLYRGVRTALIGCGAIVLGAQLLNLKMETAWSAPTPTYNGCTSPGCCPLSHGYWKNHVSQWKVTTLTLGSKSYNQTELVNLLSNPSPGDASGIMARQLIGVKLNLADGVDPRLCTPVNGTVVTYVNQADALLAGFSGKLLYNVSPSSAIGKQMVQLGLLLEAFNENKNALGCSCNMPPTSVGGNEKDKEKKK